MFTAAAQTEIGAARDVIADFVSGTDKIDISGWDSDPLSPGIDGWSFVTAFTGTVGELMYDAANHLVLFNNTTGDSDADASIELTGVATLAATDFIGVS